MMLTNRLCGFRASAAGSCVRRNAGLLLAAAVLLMNADTVLAVPAYGVPVHVIIDNTKPEGPNNVMSVQVWGDEHARVMEDESGYALIRDAGYLCYAKLSLDGSKLVSTTTKVGSVADPAAIGAAQNVHLKLGHLFSSLSALSAIGKEREAQLRSPPAVQTAGKRRALCILIQFPEKQGAVTIDQVKNFLNYDSSNKTRYSEFGNNGSVYDFFFEVSNGQLLFTHTVYGYWTAKNPRSFYDNQNKQNSGAQVLIMEALQGLASQPGGIDFSNIDTAVGRDGKTYIQLLSALYAGDMPADNGYPLWPHRWAISAASPAVDQSVQGSDGKTYYADPYQISNIGDSAAIGTFCHECGHMVCGFSDYYDTTYSSSGLGNWCLMAGGNWNNSALDPAPPHPYLRFKAGWLTPKAADSSITSLSCNLSDVIKCGNPGNAQEYYLISAIQKAGHFADMPGEGLAIFHIDESKTDNTQYQHSASQHYESALMQADGQYALEASPGNGNRGDATDLFSAQNNATAFSDSSSPITANWWNGSASGLSVTQIGSSGSSSISFRLNSQASGNGPQITSGPSATPNPAAAGQDVSFSVSASDPNNQALTFAWNFGDGSTGSGATLVHDYTATGNYNATVTVTNTSQASVSASLTVNVSVSPVTINKAKFQLNFKVSGKDSLDAIFASQDFAFTSNKTFQSTTNGFVLKVIIGSTQVDSLSLLKGHGKGAGTATWNWRNGQIHYTIRNAALQGVLSNYGAANDNTSGQVAVPLQIQINGVAYGGQYTFSYSALKNKAGKGLVSSPQR